MPSILCEEFLKDGASFSCTGYSDLVMLYITGGFRDRLVLLYDLSKKLWRRLPRCSLPDERMREGLLDGISFEPRLDAVVWPCSWNSFLGGKHPRLSQNCVHGNHLDNGNFPEDKRRKKKCWIQRIQRIGKGPTSSFLNQRFSKQFQNLFYMQAFWCICMRLGPEVLIAKYLGWKFGNNWSKETSHQVSPSTILPISTFLQWFLDPEDCIFFTWALDLTWSFHILCQESFCTCSGDIHEEKTSGFCNQICEKRYLTS